MTKTNIFKAVGVGLVVVGLAGGWLIKNNLPLKNANQTSTTSVASTPADVSQAPVSQPIPLNQATEPSASAGQLQVNGNAAPNSVAQAAGNQLGVSDQQARPSAGNTNPFDPKTFSAYEKHKNDSTALFANVLDGDGAVLEGNKSAAVYYRGWLTNGTMFDESRTGTDGKLTPFIFQLGAGKVIPGWEQALAGMKVGGVRLVIVPPAVGYKDMQQNGIPPNSVLVFQVQLAEVQ